MAARGQRTLSVEQLARGVLCLVGKARAGIALGTAHLGPLLVRGSTTPCLRSLAEPVLAHNSRLASLNTGAGSRSGRPTARYPAYFGQQLCPGQSRHHPLREATRPGVGVYDRCPSLVAGTSDPTREESDERWMAMPLHTRCPRCYANAHEAVRDCDSCRFYPGRARLHSP